MQTLNREDVFKVLDHAGFNPQHVVSEYYSPYPGADGVVALRINRDAVGRIAESAEVLWDLDELTAPLPIGELSSAMGVDQTPDEYDMVYFSGFRLSPDAKNGESVAEAEDRQQTEAGPDDVPDEAESATDTEEADPFAGMPPFLRDLLKDAKPVEIDEADLPDVIKGLTSGIQGLLSMTGESTGRPHGPHGPGCQCTTEREERIADLAWRYRKMAKREGDLKTVAMMDAILAEARS